MEIKRCFRKRLDGGWDWSAPVFLSRAGMFAECVVQSPEGRSFNSKKEAEADLKEVFRKLKLNFKK